MRYSDQNPNRFHVLRYNGTNKLIHSYYEPNTDDLLTPMTMRDLASFTRHHLNTVKNWAVRSGPKREPFPKPRGYMPHNAKMRWWYTGDLLLWLKKTGRLRGYDDLDLDYFEPKLAKEKVVFQENVDLEWRADADSGESGPVEDFFTEI